MHFAVQVLHKFIDLFQIFFLLNFLISEFWYSDRICLYLGKAHRKAIEKGQKVCL